MVLSKYINKASWKKRLQWVPASYKAAHLGGGVEQEWGYCWGRGTMGVPEWAGHGGRGRFQGCA